MNTPLNAPVTTLSKLANSIVVSVQASHGEPLDRPEIITAFAQSTLLGGACGVRLANPENIHAFKRACPDIPVIGITKPPVIPENYVDLVYITPSWQDIQQLADAGSDIVAVDATQRTRKPGETLEDMIKKTRATYPNLLLMADIATLEEGILAEKYGFDLISTTLAGYTRDTMDQKDAGPAFELLKALKQRTKTPIILEGRVWKPWEVSYAFEAGAFCVVIGSAITRPHEITRRFVQAIPNPAQAASEK